MIDNSLEELIGNSLRIEGQLPWELIGNSFAVAILKNKFYAV